MRINIPVLPVLLALIIGLMGITFFVQYLGITDIGWRYTIAIIGVCVLMLMHLYEEAAKYSIRSPFEELKRMINNRRNYGKNSK